MRSLSRQLPLPLAFALIAWGPVACDKPPGSGETPDTGDPTTCAGHKEGDPCVDAEAFTACKEAEAECPGEVVTMESCPLQFSCG